MPTLLFSFKETPSGHIMFHGFTGPGERAAEKDLQGHAGICPQFGPAHRAGKTIDMAVDVDELPEFNEESIKEWLDDLLGIDEDDDEDDMGEAGAGGPEDEEEDEDEEQEEDV